MVSEIDPDPLRYQNALWGREGILGRIQRVLLLLLLHDVINLLIPNSPDYSMIIKKITFFK